MKACLRCRPSIVVFSLPALQGIAEDQRQRVSDDISRKRESSILPIRRSRT